ncbi:MAG TPA: hypothetical protein EYP36_03785 [Calditrichaeota bacterium]|nr:hypothetical protein [Calditrichota bacterium]
MLPTTVLIVFIFLIYSVQHSFFASLQVKKYFRKHLIAVFPYYRFIYTVVQGILFLVLWIYLPKPPFIIWDVHGPYVYLFKTVQGFAGLGLLYAFSQFSLYEFSGIGAIHRSMKGTISEEDELYRLNQNGLYAVSRHPIYFFTRLIFLFRPKMTWFGLLFIIWLGVYFHIGSLLEEKRMEYLFPQEYVAYKKQVSRIFPFKYLRNKLVLLTGRIFN